ncbi:MAG: phospho-N-acetylmuramoyl-pentapeptide-transferase [Gaiellaceae bacterium]
MDRVIAAAILAMVISIVAGPKFIRILRDRELGQQIRAEMPAGHVVKQGTPTMGGLLMLLGAVIPFLILSEYTLPGLTILAVTLACGGIGFLDDFIKLRHRRSLGLSGRWKLLLLVAISIFLGYAAHREGLNTKVYLPALGTVDLWWFWYVLIFLVVAGAANGVNLTDGIDGLAAGTGIISLITFTAICIFTFIRLRQVGEPNQVYLDMAIVGGALVGGAIGFLWFNAFPADVFMGDTGSMAIGGALGAFAVMTKTELLLLLVGGIFLIEALSVILQVISFKYWGRRIFLMAPIHHHFEMKAWSDTKIMVRFWILGAILCASAFAVYFQYFFKFPRP